MAEADPAALARLSSPDEEVRSDACLSLAGAGETAVSSLSPLLKDTSMLVRHSAAYALSRIGGTAVEKIFRDGLSSASYDIRRVSAIGLGMMGQRGVREAVAPLLEDKNWEVRWAAAFALGKGGDRRAAAMLAPLARSDPYQDQASGGYPVRVAAQEALGRLNGNIGWETDPEPALARAETEKKPAFLYFRRSGSPLCQAFEKESLMDEKIIDVLQRCAPVWIDYGSARPAFDRWSVSEVPVCILLAPDGKEEARVKGGLPPEDLLGKILRTVEKDRIASRLEYRLEKSPRDWEAAWQLAALYLDQEQWGKARERAGRIISGDPDNLSSLLDNALFARAYIAGRLGDYQSSLAEFAALLQRYPAFGERSQALYCAGLSALKLGKKAAAGGYFQTLKKAYPGTPLAAAAEKIVK
jgi:tetratricopeptide (TPR) repeat protein